MLADEEQPITESTAEAISEDVQDAADAVDEATETVADAADPIEEANEAIAEVAEQTEEAVEAVEEASEAVAESTEAIEDAADAVDDATEAVEDAAEQIQDTAETVEEVAADVEDATAAVDEATEAVEDAADSLADITDTAQEVLSNLEGSKAVNSLVMDKVEQEQGAVATELLTMAKEINRLEAVVTRLENYEGGGRRGGPGSGAGLGAWFKAQYADQTSFISGLVTSFLVILFIEVGDRTYFIAALMSVKHSRRIVFLGAFSALAVMTIVSTLLGVAAPMFLPRWFVHWAAVILFLGYGVTMLYNSQFMSDERFRGVRGSRTRVGRNRQPTIWEEIRRQQREQRRRRRGGKRRQIVAWKEKRDFEKRKAMVGILRLCDFRPSVYAHLLSGMGRPIPNRHHRHGCRLRPVRYHHRRFLRPRFSHFHGVHWRSHLSSENIREENRHGRAASF